MLKLSPDEIRAFSHTNLDADGQEWYQILADHAADHAAKEVYQFVLDFETINYTDFQAKYKLTGWPASGAMRFWLRSQSVEV